MIQGEIWLVEFADAKGHEQAGTRPVVLLSGETVNVCIVVPLTSNQLASRFPHTILVEPSSSNGLDAKSVILAFQMRSIDTQRLIKKIGVLEAGIMDELKELIKDIIKI